MVCAISYIVAEWCTQSHLSTENYEAAARGLRRNRTFKKYTLWLRMPVEGMIGCVRALYNARHGFRKANGRRSIVWSARGHSLNRIGYDLEQTTMFSQKEAVVSEIETEPSEVSEVSVGMKQEMS